jgi:simple sugar transport system permease protein
MNEKKRGPLAHIVKRPAISWKKAAMIRGAAIVISILVCAAVTFFLTGSDPISVFRTILDGSFASPRRFWVLLQNISILLIISLAMAPAFRMRFWNIGGEGQVMMGVLATSSCMIMLGGKVPNALLIVIEIIAAIAAGAIWAAIPAFFKSRWNTNETLFTLMMNYVATQLVAYFIIKWESPRGSGKIGIINQSTQYGWLPQIGEYKYLLTVIVAAALTVFLYIYMNKSKHGYELAVVGESERTARYVGIKVGRVFVRTMLLSGAICGVAGLLMVGSTDHTMTTTLAGGRGFTAVMVAWMAKFNPIGMIFTSFLLAFLGKGAGEVATQFGLNQSFSDILSSIIIFFLIGCEFFIQYRIVFRKEAN